MPLCCWDAWRGWKQMAGDAGLLDQPVGELDAVAVARAQARAQLDRDRQAAALARGARDRDRRVGVVSSAAPAPVLQTFGTGQPMFRSIRSAPAARDAGGGRAHDSGSWPNSWIETGPPAARGVDAQQLVHVFSLP